MQRVLKLHRKTAERSVDLQFITTTREEKAMVISEQKHWIRHDLEWRSHLSQDKYQYLKEIITVRKGRCINEMSSFSEIIRGTEIEPKILLLDEINTQWPQTLTSNNAEHSENNGGMYFRSKTQIPRCILKIFFLPSE